MNRSSRAVLGLLVTLVLAGAGPAPASAAPSPTVTDRLAQLIGVATPSTLTPAALRRTLDAQTRAIGRLADNGERVIATLRTRRTALAGLRRDLQALVRIGDRRSRQVQQALLLLPAVQRDAQTTVERLRTFADRTDPVVRQLGPVVREAAPTFRAFAQIAPDLRALLGDLGPLITSSRRGLPAVAQIADAVRPPLEQLDPLLRELTPALRETSLYPDQIRAFLASASTVTPARARGTAGPRPAALRTLVRLQPDPPVSSGAKQSAP